MSDLKTEPVSRRETPEVDSPPSGWCILDVMRTQWRSWDWVALMIDVEPDEYRSGCQCSRCRTARSCWVRIAGKHRDRDAAWVRLDDVMATRH
jgi:hypothetical protein